MNKKLVFILTLSFFLLLVLFINKTYSGWTCDNADCIQEICSISRCYSSIGSNCRSTDYSLTGNIGTGTGTVCCPNNCCGSSRYDCCVSPNICCCDYSCTSTGCPSCTVNCSNYSSYPNTSCDTTNGGTCTKSWKTCSSTDNCGDSCTGGGRYCYSNPSCSASCGSCSAGIYFSSAPTHSYVSGSRKCIRTNCTDYYQNCYNCSTGCRDGGTYYGSQPANVSTIKKYYYSDCSTVNKCYICNTGCHSGGTYYASTPSVSTSVIDIKPYTYSNCTTENKCYTCQTGCGACSQGDYHATQPANTYVPGRCTYTNSNCSTNSKNCYLTCPDAPCSNLESEVNWQDTIPAGTYVTYEGNVPTSDPNPPPLSGTTYSCPSVEYKKCYYPNQLPQVVSVQAHEYGGSVKGYTSVDHTGLDLNNPARVTATYTDADNHRTNEIEAVYVWWSTSGTKNFSTPNKLNSSLTGKTANNANFGIMIRRNSLGELGDVYIPHIDGTTRTWYRVGDKDSPRAINLNNTTTLATVYNIGVTESNVGGKWQVDLEMLMDFEEHVNTNQYHLWGSVSDQVGFLPFEGYTDIVVPNSDVIGHMLSGGQTWNVSGDWNLDMINPEDLSIAIVAIEEGEVSVTVKGNDANDGMNLAYARLDACREEYEEGGLKELIVNGNAENYLPSPSCSDFENNARINFSSSEVNNSILGSISSINAATFDITKEIDFNGNDDGTITFYLTVNDLAGNNVYVSEIYRLGDWVIVQDGLVYGGEGVSSSTRLQENDGVWPSDSSYPLRKYFSSPTLVDLTNQALLSQRVGSLLRELRRTSDNKSFQTRNFTGLAISNPYVELMEVHDAKKEVLAGSYTEIPVNDGTITGTLTNPISGVTCSTDYCAIISDGPLTISSGFKCDKKGLIVSNGNITINPDFTNNNADTDACIILANGDINITASGSDSTYPITYDQIEAFLIAQDTIGIQSNGTKNDYGLMVEGGLTAFDLASGVKNERVIHFSLKENFPALAVKGNSKYGLLSRILFGSQIDIFQSEVGFKPY